MNIFTCTDLRNTDFTVTYFLTFGQSKVINVNTFHSFSKSIAGQKRLKSLLGILKKTKESIN